MCILAGAALSLTCAGRYDMDIFCTEVFPYGRELFSGWVNSSETGMMVFSSDEDSPCADNRLAYIKSLPVGRATAFPCKLIILLNENLLRQNMDELRWLPESRMLIINSKDQTFISDMSLSDISGISYNALSYASGSLSSGGKSHILQSVGYF
jgi:hypothetical protein